ncbi:MAG: CrcB family protein [Frankiales bacterium]|nr:CrcB family protein [Frankiales bacterium]
MAHLPIDPDIESVGDPLHPFQLSVLATVFIGGCAGGLVRYLLSQHWPATHLFPWAVFTVNVAGAFVLGAVVVASEVAGPSSHLRPLIGTGFCGALTTFSSLVVAADELAAHGHAGLAATYVLASVAAGVAAAWLGLTLCRRITGWRDEAAPGAG